MSDTPNNVDIRKWLDFYHNEGFRLGTTGGGARATIIALLRELSEAKAKLEAHAAHRARLQKYVGVCQHARDVTACGRWQIQTVNEREGAKWERHYELWVSHSLKGGAPWIVVTCPNTRRDAKAMAQQLMDGGEWESCLRGPPDWLTQLRPNPVNNYVNNHIT